jgi:hypothetical protein
MRGAKGLSRWRTSRGMASFTGTAKARIADEAHRGQSVCASPAKRATRDMTHTR